MAQSVRVIQYSRYSTRMLKCQHALCETGFAAATDPCFAGLSGGLARADLARENQQPAVALIRWQWVIASDAVRKCVRTTRMVSPRALSV